MPERGSVVFYISGHGFGHASRQIEVINALGALPDAPRIIIRTAAARWLFERTVRVPFTFVQGETDTGVVQIDSLRLDEQATLREANAFHAALDERAREEEALLARDDARLVVCDAPPLGCAAAAAARIPAIVVANFTWDWIYAGYDEAARTPGLVPRIEEAYARASAGWRLPMWGGFETVPNVRDLPFVARHARHEPSHVRAVLGLPAATPLVLSSFGGYGMQAIDLTGLDCLDRYGVVMTGRDATRDAPAGVFVVDEDHLYDRGLRYEDLVGAADVVLTKPGYGIISECIANSTALLYTSRGRFAEYDVLVREMPRYLRCGFIENEAMFAGRWRAPIDAVLSQRPPPERPPTDGARVAARWIQGLLAGA